MSSPFLRKEAQKCYCEAATCRGWLGERPDDDSEDEDEEEEEEEDEGETESAVVPKVEIVDKEGGEIEAMEVDLKIAEVAEEGAMPEVKVEKMEAETAAVPVTPKRKSPRKKPRKDLFEELDVSDMTFCG